MPDQETLESLEDTDRKARVGLTGEQQEQLSKALFPDTHTDEVEVLGETRTLRPLPIKFARQLHSILQPVTKKLTKAAASGDAKSAPDVDKELLEGCLKSAKILCAFYDWPDLKAALDEEMIELSEVQALLVQQAALQKANDFLLTPLRVAVGTMRFVEVGTLQYLNTFSGLRSSNNIDALLQTSLARTPSDS